MRISDWSSDVCSSDLTLFQGQVGPDPVLPGPPRRRNRSIDIQIVGKPNHPDFFPVCGIGHHVIDDAVGIDPLRADQEFLEPPVMGHDAITFSSWTVSRLGRMDATAWKGRPATAPRRQRAN